MKTPRIPRKASTNQFPSDIAIGELTVNVGSFANRSQMFRSIRLSTGPYPGRISLLVVLALIAGILDALVLFAVAKLALLLAKGSDASATLGLGPLGRYDLAFSDLLIVTAVMLVAVGLINVPMARITASLSRSTLTRSRNRILSAYLRASWGHRSTHFEGRLQEYMTSYSNKNEGVILQISTIIVMLWSITAIGLAAIALAGWAALAGAVALGLIAVVLRPLTKRIKAQSAMQAKLNKEFASAVAQTARVAPEIATFDVADAVAAAGVELAKPTGDSLAQLRFLTKVIPTTFQYSALGVILAVIYAVYTFDLGDLAVFGPLVVLLMRALGNMKQLQLAAQAILQLHPYVDGMEDEIADLNAHPMPHGTIPLTEIGTVRLEHVDYAYVAGQPVLENVNFEFGDGEAIGIVGPSGGGKSTLSQLLTGLRSPTSGRIMIGDVDLEDATIQSWSHLMALVPQDNSLIRASVADNIRFFRTGFSDDDVKAAAQAAYLHNDIVSQLPDGYETRIGAGERELSGGQRQRLGIARALLGRPRLLVLDEPTSALDERSEELIRQTLEEIKGTTSLIVIAHRPSTLRVCDRVFRVADGAVSELSQGGSELVPQNEELAADDFQPAAEWQPPLLGGARQR